MTLKAKQNVRILNGTRYNPSEENQVFGLVVRELPGGEYVVLDIGDEIDVIAKVQDVELMREEP